MELINKEINNDKISSFIPKKQIYIDSGAAMVEESNKMLNQVELTEAFKSDDQIGFFFKSLINIQESLNHYLKK